MRVYVKKEVKDDNSSELAIFILLSISIAIFVLGFILLDGVYTFYNFLTILHKGFLIPFILGILFFGISMLGIYYGTIKPLTINEKYIATLIRKEEEEYCDHKITNMAFVYTPEKDKRKEYTYWCYSVGSNDCEINKQYILKKTNRELNIEKLNQENIVIPTDENVIKDIKSKEKKKIKEKNKVKTPSEIYERNRKKFFKNISNKSVVLIAVILDIVLFIIFANGVTIFTTKGFIYAIKALGYCSILNLFGIIGIEIILLNIIDIYLSHKRFTVPVTATCIGNDRVLFDRDYDSDGRNTPTYITSWKYEYENQIYIVKNTLATNFDMPKIDSIRKIYINPNSPNDDYYDPTFVKKKLPLYLFMGSASILGYIGIIDVGLLSGIL